MILSFHPCFIGDKNIICAGRNPDTKDLAAIKASAAVVLPQGCGELLYKMARENCAYVFPDYDARYKYPGKIGQLNLFKETDVKYPKTEIFLNIGSFFDRYGREPDLLSFDFPLVFKFAWGGEGHTVHLIKSAEKLKSILQTAAKYENSGQVGFFLQEFIPSNNRSLRVVVIGKNLFSYWRIQEKKDTFHTSLAKGAKINSNSDQDLQQQAKKTVSAFCKKMGINLAGFDLLFEDKKESGLKPQEPFFIEINYFFGRQGLGGSENYYALLNNEIQKWLAGLDL